MNTFVGLALFVYATAGVPEGYMDPRFQSYGNLSPEQAVDILRTSTDWPLIVEALKTAAMHPETRQEAIKYVEDPPNLKAVQERNAIKYRTEMRSMGFDEDQIMENAWNGEIIPGILTFLEFVARQDDPEAFPVLLHVNLEKFGTNSDLDGNITPLFRPGTKYEEFLLNYFTKNPDMASIAYMADAGSQPADKLYYEILLGDEFWEKTRGSGLGADVWSRYNPRTIFTYHMLLLRGRRTDETVGTLFAEGYVNGMPAAPFMEEAPPIVYPQLLSFILDAEKVKLSDGARELLATSKAKLLDLMAKHNMPPVPAPFPYTGRAVMALDPPDQPASNAAAPSPPAHEPVHASANPPPLATTSAAPSTTPYYAAAIILVLLGLLILLARRKA